MKSSFSLVFLFLRQKAAPMAAALTAMIAPQTKPCATSFQIRADGSFSLTEVARARYSSQYQFHSQVHYSQILSQQAEGGHLGGSLERPFPDLHLYALVFTTLPLLSVAIHYQREEYSPFSFSHLQVMVFVSLVVSVSVIQLVTVSVHDCEMLPPTLNISLISNPAFIS